MYSMNNRLFISVSVLLMSLLALSSCDNREDTLFDKPALERAADLAEECEKTLLASPNGWEMTYKVPAYDIDATFHAQLKFEPNKQVTIWTDYLDEPVTSTYKMSLFEGAVLTFDTPGALTELANPANFPNESMKEKRANKAGYYGENDFVIVSVSPDKVVLRGLKYGHNEYAQDIVLTKLTTPPSMSNKGVGKAFNTGLLLLSNWGNVREVWSGEDVLYSIEMDLPEIERFMSSMAELPSISMSLFDMDDNEVGGKRAVTITDDGLGIHIEPGIDYKGKTYTDFLFDEEKTGYVAKGEPELWINLSPLDPIVPMLRPGGYFTRNLFVFNGADGTTSQLFDPKTIDATIPGFVTLQWYLYPDLMEFDFMRKNDAGETVWPGFKYQLVEVMPAQGIYQIVFKGATDDLISAALGAEDLNAVNLFASFFTTAGGKKNMVKISIVDLNKGIVRIQELNSDYHLWIEFAFIPPKN